jgi:hypothetical protein
LSCKSSGVSDVGSEAMEVCISMTSVDNERHSNSPSSLVKMGQLSDLQVLFCWAIRFPFEETFRVLSRILFVVQIIAILVSQKSCQKKAKTSQA